jgi:hypothetical protein
MTLTAHSLDKIAQALGGEVRSGEVLAPGPGHSASDRSLAVKLDPNADSGFLVHSFSGDDWKTCDAYVRDKLGLSPFEPKTTKGNGKGRGTYTVVASYIYRDENGEPYLRVDRLADKTFPQYHWDGAKWIKGAPKGPRIPYRLPQLIAASPTTPIYICEGEKDADNLAKLGFTTTCNPEGAGKWKPELNKYFKDRNVCILPDNDDAGRKHAQLVARNLDKIAASLRVVQLPDLPPKGDVTDWLAGDPAGARLVKCCTAAPIWEPPGDGAGTDEERVAELAALSPLDYAKRRKEIAEELGIAVHFLDDAVKQARGETRSKGKDHPAYWEVEPWDEAVDTGDLLSALRDAYKRHVILPPHAAVTMALWVLHAWALEAAYASPFLVFTSPVPRCGKSTALALLRWTAPRSALASNISPAAIYRFIEASCPTLLIDEADSFFGRNEELRGILNSGHTRDTAMVIRLVGDDHVPKRFSTWAPKAIGSIGKITETLRDRSIVLPMKRKRSGERIERLRGRDTAEFLALRRKAARWAADNVAALSDARPPVPEGLNDRATDNWEPLLAIAELAGGDWPQAARAAALALSSDAEPEDDTLKIRLLADIRAAFRTLGTERETSASLILELVKDDEGPWVEFGKSGKPITPKKLARLLEDFRIQPRKMRLPGSARPSRGYDLAWFEDAFERYLPSSPPEPPFNAEHPEQTSKINSLDEKQSGTFDFNVPDQNGENVNNINDVPDVPVRKGGSGDNRGVDALLDDVGPHACDWCHQPPDGREQLCAILDETVWLHPECEATYLQAIETASESDAPAPAVRSVGECRHGEVCVRCGGEADDYRGPVQRFVNDRIVGCKSEPLHEVCAAEWFSRAPMSTADDLDDRGR